MHDFTYCVPTEIVFGKNSVSRLPELLKSRNISRLLLVCGSGSAKKSGLLDRIFSLLEAAQIRYDVLEGVQPNPRCELARVGVEKALALDAELILAVGGGSVIDTAKAVAHGKANPETDIWDFWSKKETVQKSTPVGVVLTIAAAGSETSDSAVLTNETERLKRGLTTQFNRPAFAIMDPALASTLAPHQISCGVTDIMMHTLDRYFNPVCDNALTDALAEALLRVVIEKGKLVAQNAGDLDAMSEIMWAGSLSHNGLTGLGGEKDFAVHQLGHAVSERYDVYHGDSLAAVWSSWAQYVCPANASRFARYGKNVWGICEENDEKAAAQAIEATRRFFASIQMPTALSQLSCGKLSDEAVRELAMRCSYQKTRSIGTFRKLCYEDILTIYQNANA